MKGILPSLNTPFSKKGDLDLKSLEKLVKHTIRSGCSGMLGLAVAGEHKLLSFQEKIAFIELVKYTNKERIPFIVSVSDLQNEDSIKLSKIAKKNNATGINIQINQNTSTADNLKLLKEIAKVGPEIIMVQDLDWLGTGLSQKKILKLFDEINKFKWLKIETQNAVDKAKPGILKSILKSYETSSKIKKITKNKLHVCGGWAVTQLIDALNRGVDAFIPTGLEFLYVKVYNLYNNGQVNKARNLFNEILPIINFSNQNIDISIKFFKEVRVKERIFSCNFCRKKEAKFDKFQHKEANKMLNLINLNEKL